ncbi:hypothetical protein V6N13_082976 [Hibiscus sabdariffa]
MTDALQAKLWAIYDDHIFAWSLGISRLQLQTDNLMAENLLKNATATSNSFSVVRAIVTLLQHAWVVDILWIPRAGNDPAN